MHCIQTQNIGPLFHRGWCTEPANSKPGTLQRDYYCSIYAGFETFLHARNLPLRRQWMQQDGATAQMVGESLACLQQHFNNRLISHGMDSRSIHTPWISQPQMPTYGTC